MCVCVCVSVCVAYSFLLLDNGGELSVGYTRVQFTLHKTMQGWQNCSYHIKSTSVL